VTIAAVAIMVVYLAILAGDDPVVADRHAMRVTSQVVQELARPGKGSLRIDHPRFLAAAPQPTATRVGLGEFSQRRRYLQLAPLQQFGQPIQVLGAKHLAQSMYRKEELPAPGNPPRTVIGQRTGSDQAMEVKVRPQLLIPCMQHEREADLAVELVVTKLQQGLGRRI